jgi:hypothetical protein
MRVILPVARTKYLARLGRSDFVHRAADPRSTVRGGVELFHFTTLRKSGKEEAATLVREITV